MPIPIYLILADEKKRNGEVLILQETPGGVLHGLAAPDWRGEICVGRTSMLTQKIDGEFRLTARVQVAHLKVRRVGARRAPSSTARVPVSREIWQRQDLPSS